MLPSPAVHLLAQQQLQGTPGSLPGLCWDEHQLMHHFIPHANLSQTPGSANTEASATTHHVRDGGGLCSSVQSPTPPALQAGGLFNFPPVATAAVTLWGPEDRLSRPVSAAAESAGLRIRLQQRQSLQPGQAALGWGAPMTSSAEFAAPAGSSVTGGGPWGLDGMPGKTLSFPATRGLVWAANQHFVIHCGDIPSWRFQVSTQRLHLLASGV